MGIFTPFFILWTYRKTLCLAIISELRIMYAGTTLGFAWIVLGPIILLVLYAVIYAIIFRVRIPNFTVQEYVLNVFSGLVPFLAFAQTLSAASSIFQKDKALVYNMNFPTELIHPKTIFVSNIILPIGMIITFIGDLAVSEISATWFFLPVILFFQIIFSIGVAYYISLLSLIFKDIQIMIQYIMIALLVITPIAYTPDMIPKGLFVMLYINPLFYFVYSYQHIILLNSMPPLGILIITCCFSFIVYYSGLFIFNKVKLAASDLI